MVLQEFPGASRRRLPQPLSPGQVAITGEAYQRHHHAEANHLQYGGGHEPAAKGTEEEEPLGLHTFLFYFKNFTVDLVTP